MNIVLGIALAGAVLGTLSFFAAYMKWSRGDTLSEPSPRLGRHVGRSIALMAALTGMGFLIVFGVALAILL